MVLFKVWVPSFSMLCEVNCVPFEQLLADAKLITITDNAFWALSTRVLMQREYSW